MTSKLAVRRLATLALLAALMQPLQGVAAHLLNTAPGLWPSGRIVWTYNPSGRPAGISDAEVIALVTEAFASWSRVCAVQGIYGGLTDVAAEPSPRNVFVVGWANMDGGRFSARAGPTSNALINGYAAYTGGALRLNNHPDGAARVLASRDNGTLLATLLHEVGHVLGLAHSDEPSSILFANPYNSPHHNLYLQGDDITGCADLYGARGVSALPDQRSAAPAPVPYALQASIVEGDPGSAWPVSSLATIDPLAGVSYSFSVHFRDMPLGTRLQWRWLSPLGTTYVAGSELASTVVTGRLRYTSASVRLPFAGDWSYQLWADGNLVANQPFRVLRGTLEAATAYEAAWVGERDSAGRLFWRHLAFGPRQPLRHVMVRNSQVEAGVSSSPQPGLNTMEFWTQTNRPRYLVGQAEGQREDTLDVMRRVVFSATAGGALVAAPLTAVESGTTASYSAGASVVIDGAGPQGVFVAASVGGVLHFRTPAGWSTTASPLFTVQAPAVVALDLVRNLDVRSLPPGTTLYVGHGRTLDEVVRLAQYRVVRMF